MEYPEVFIKVITDWYWHSRKDATEKELQEFLTWNESKVRFYVEWWKTYDGSGGTCEMEDEANHYERATIARRFELFLQDTKSKQQ